MSEETAELIVVPASWRRTWYKRPLDLGILLFSHVLLLPLWLGLWTVIPLGILLLDGRPIFYRKQARTKGGVVFDALKFRTMVPGSDTGPAVWTEEGDPRITRMGKILRKTALDELPQVYNILKGEMSFVGPRALSLRMIEHSAAVAPGFEQRFQVNAGLTGLGQVFGDRIEPLERLQNDLEYIRRMSPWMDIKLLFLSVWVTFRAKWESRKGDRA